MQLRNGFPRIVLLLALSLFLSGAAPVWAGGAEQAAAVAAAEQRALSVAVGESRIVQVRSLERVAVADPNIADVLVVSANEVIINGKQAGTTSLHLWEAGERRSFTVKVEADDEALAAQVREAVNDERIQVKVLRGTVFLEGTVEPQAAARAEKIAKAYSAKVANLLVVEKVAVNPDPAPAPVPKEVPAPAGAAPVSPDSEDPEPAAPAVSREELPALVEEAIGLSTVKARLIGDMLLLDGTVSEARESERALQIAQAMASGVVSKVTAALSVVPMEPPQVLLQVQVAEVANDSLNQLGITWGTNTVTSSGTVFVPGVSWVGESAAMDFVFGRLTPLTGQLDAMLKEGTATLLAAPSILTRSGKPAEFLAGGEIPVVIYNKDQYTVYWKEYGVKLAMLPEVRTDEAIMVHLKPEVSTLDWANGAKINNGLFPALKTRRAETDVRLRNGTTLVIGGLLNNEEAKNSQGVPFLSKLPIIGHLFASKGFQSGRTQLVIFVTPHLIREGESPEAGEVINPRTAKGSPAPTLAPVPESAGTQPQSGE